MGTPEMSFKKYSKKEWLDFIQNTMKHASLEDHKWKISDELEGQAFAHLDDMEKLPMPMSEELDQNTPLLCWTFQPQSQLNKQLIESFDAVSIDKEMLAEKEQIIPADQLALIKTKSEFNSESINRPHLLQLPNAFNSDIAKILENIESNPDCQGIAIDFPDRLEKKSVVETISDFWIDFISWIKVLAGDSSKLKILFEKLHFQTRLTSDFIYEIAFIRAVKLLYYNIQQNLGVEISPCNIIADLDQNILSESMSDRLILSTVISMAASLGGVKMLQINVDPSEDKALENVRWLRNIQLIMKNESNMSQVLDPIAGSYVIENLSNILANSIWDEIPNEI